MKEKKIKEKIRRIKAERDSLIIQRNEMETARNKLNHQVKELQKQLANNSNQWIKKIKELEKEIAFVKQCYYEYLEQFEGLLAQLVKGEKTGWTKDYQKTSFELISKEMDNLRKQLNSGKKFKDLVIPE